MSSAFIETPSKTNAFLKVFFFWYIGRDVCSVFALTEAERETTEQLKQAGLRLVMAKFVPGEGVGNVPR